MLSKSSGKAALHFVILIGITSLFADFTYEAARSINGQFLAVLGASATVVGFAAGFGELAGYVVCAQCLAGYYLFPSVWTLCTSQNGGRT